MAEDFYKILGVRWNATDEQIGKAFGCCPESFGVFRLPLLPRPFHNLADFSGFACATRWCNAIMSEWTRMDLSYQSRIDHIVGTNTDSAKNLLGGQYYFLTASGDGRTVLSDGAADKLTGSAGQDWFFVNHFADAGDCVLGKVTDLGTLEQSLDLSWIV